MSELAQLRAAARVLVDVLGDYHGTGRHPNCPACQVIEVIQPMLDPVAAMIEVERTANLDSIEFAAACQLEQQLKRFLHTPSTVERRHLEHHLDQYVNAWMEGRHR